MKKIFIFIIFILNLFHNNFSFQYSTTINKYYKNIAGNILHNKIIRNIEYYNYNKSISYNFYGKYKLKYTLIDNYNYIIHFNIYKYKYLININVIPITYLNTTLNIDIRHDKNLKHLNLINKKIINKIIAQINKTKDVELSTDLFKFFNDF